MAVVRAHDVVEELLRARTEPNERFFAAQSDRIATLCHRMAERFARGGRLIAFGASDADRSDARHVAVEFVHPVIVGKRALPAIAMAPDAVALMVQPDDIVIGFGGGPEIEAVIAVARPMGAETIAFRFVGAAWEFSPPVTDPFVAQELAETLYHVLWELVHVFFEHRGLLEGRDPGPVHDAGASAFLYPFLDQREDDLGAVLADVAASARIKAADAGALRERTLREHGGDVLAAAHRLRACFDAGGRLLALGNGGSATDAMDAVADFRRPPPARRWPARPALDLTEDPAILTAIANDVGVEAIFARQVIAHGRRGDALLALSTSGGSANVLAALAQARKRGLLTIALVGYDGGRIAAEALADHVIVAPSEYIPRIQEAQATAYHALRALVEDGG
jgi:D-sedoheptulose 7-phosphate isomerase